MVQLRYGNIYRGPVCDLKASYRYKNYSYSSTNRTICERLRRVRIQTRRSCGADAFKRNRRTLPDALALSTLHWASVDENGTVKLIVASGNAYWSAYNCFG